MTEQRQWTHDELKGLLEVSSIKDLEKLIANPEHKYRQEFANTYAINALRDLTESDVLPEDIRSLVQRTLDLHEQASDPFLGMNLPRRGIDAEDAEAQARQDWSNDE